MELGAHAGTPFRHMDVHVCTDDIDSLQHRHADIYWQGLHWKRYGQTRLDKNTMLISDDYLYTEYINRMFWGHIKLL